MRRTNSIFLSLTLLAGVLFANVALAENRALLIGIGYYEVAGAELPGVDQDIKMMREVAEKLGYLPSQIMDLSHSQATLQGIRDSIETWLIDGTTPEDRVLFYHSGHGTLVPDQNGDEEDGNDEALLPYDFAGGVPHKEGRLNPTRVLRDDELGRLLKKIPAREVVVLVDSCHSGTMTRAITRTPRKFYRYPNMPTGPASSLVDKRLDRYESVILVSAAQPEQEAQTSNQGALFTQGIYHAVSSAQAHRELTIDRLRSEAEAFIDQAVGDRTQLRHTPTLDGNLALSRLNLFLPMPTRPRISSRPTPPPAPVHTALPPAPVHTAPPPAPAKTTPSPPPPVAPPPPASTPAVSTPAVSKPTVSTPAVSTPSVTDDAGGRGELWDRLEELVGEADNGLAVRAAKTEYRVGESLDLSVVAPGDGYLHILNIGDGDDEIVMLFPNRYQPINLVQGGETVRMPDPNVFRLPADLPSGRSWQRNLVVVIHTVQPVNLLDDARSAEEIFRVLDGDEGRILVRSFHPAGPKLAGPTYSAGRVVVTIAN